MKHIFNPPSNFYFLGFKIYLLINTLTLLILSFTTNDTEKQANVKKDVCILFSKYYFHKTLINTVNIPTYCKKMILYLITNTEVFSALPLYRLAILYRMNPMLG